MKIKAITSTAAILQRLTWTACCAAGLLATHPANGETATVVYDAGPARQPTDPIDKLVMANLTKLGVQPVLCSDAVFIRRLYLDVLGKLPTADEARTFILDPDQTHKRRKLIDQVLARDEYTDLWAMRWGDVLRIKAEFPVNLWPNAAQAYHRWVRSSIASNKPYDQFVRELLTSSGSNFRVGPVNFYRAVQNRTPDGIAAAVMLTFLGTRAESLPADRRQGLTAFFSQIGYKPTNEWKEEHVFWDPLGVTASAGNAAPGRPAIVPPADAPATPAPPAPPPAANPAAPQDKPRMGLFPDGKTIYLPRDRDPREVFAAWLITPENPWFARAVVNRYWAWLLGRGIIHEPDDIRPNNPAANPALLAHLEREFVASRYDLKHLCRLILNSQTYQFSSVPRFPKPEATANFASYPLRRMDAEVLIDAINQVTGATDLYTSAIPEPFTYIPENLPAVSLPDGSITSSFLALFGRSARATGMWNERNTRPVPAQWLFLLNSSQIQRKLEQSTQLKELCLPSRPAAAIVEDLYLTILSRYPTSDEMAAIEAYRQTPAATPANNAKATAANNAKATAASNGKATAASNGKATPASNGKATPASRPNRPAAVVKRRDDWLDLAWALINSTEFLYHH